MLVDLGIPSDPQVTPKEQCCSLTSATASLTRYPTHAVSQVRGGLSSRNEPESCQVGRSLPAMSCK